MLKKKKKLRGAGEQVAMTPEEKLEYRKCKNDVFYFAKYFTIIGPEGEEKMKWREVGVL